MKNTIASSVLVLAALAPSAQAEDKVALCKSYAVLGQAIMTARQSNMPMSKVLEFEPSDTQLHRKFVTLAAMNAYEVPAYRSPEFQQRAIGIFRDEVMLSCMKSK